MLKKLYILDIDISDGNGGSGKASYDIVKGMLLYYKVIFIP